MKDIGVFDSKSTILIEIVTKMINGSALELDNPIRVSIQRQSGDSVINIDSVILNSTENEETHSYEYDLSGLQEGNYYLVYIINSQGNTYQKVESFKLVKTELELQNESLNEEKSYGEKLRDVLSPDFQISSSVDVHDNKMTIHLNEEINPNHTYMVVVTDDVVSKDSGQSIGGNYGIQFTSEYQPLYASPLEVKSVLKNIFFYFEVEEVYEALRNAAQKAHQYLRMPADPMENDFELIDSEETTYFPANRFSIYQASIQLLNQLLIKMVYTNSDNYLDEEGTEIIQDNNDGFKLGDFSVSSSQSSEGTIKKDEEPLETLMIKRLIDSFQLELKFWTDALMGINARGYASAVSAISKGNVIAPESRDFS